MPDIFDELLKERGPSSGDIFDVISKEKKPSFAEKTRGVSKAVERPAQIAGRDFLSGLLGFPGDVLELIGSGSEKLAELGKQQRIEQGEFISPQSEQLTKKIVSSLQSLRKLPLPNSQKVREFIQERSRLKGSSVEPETPAEQIASKIGGFSGAAALGSPAGALRRLAGGALSGAAAGTAEQLGAGPQGQLIAGLTAPALGSVLNGIRKGTFSPTREEAKQLYEFGKKSGFSEKQLTPLLQSEEKLGILSKFARNTPKVKRTIKEIGSQFEDTFGDIRDRAKSIGRIPVQQQNKIVDSFQNLLEDLKTSKLPSDDKKLAIEKVEQLIKSIDETGLNAASLVDTFRDINKSINWKKAGQGEKSLARIKNPIKEAINEADPLLAQDFELSNRLYQKFKGFEEKFSPSQAKTIAEGIIAGGEALGILHGIATLNFSELATLLGVEAARRIGTELLVNPRWQSIGKNAFKGLKSNDPKAITHSFNQMKKQMKDTMPEIFDEIDWDAISQRKQREK